MKNPFISPDQFQKILGQTFIKQGQKPLLEIGRQTWNKYQLGKMGIAHPAAATHLNGICQQLEIKSLNDLGTKLPGIVNLKGVGATTVYAVLGLLEAAGIDAEGAYGERVTVASLKARAKKQKGARKRNSIKRKA